jgi:hypothetical protein
LIHQTQHSLFLR